jgi:hypothetical protein
VSDVITGRTMKTEPFVLLVRDVRFSSLYQSWTIINFEARVRDFGDVLVNDSSNNLKTVDYILITLYSFKLYYNTLNRNI